MNDINEKVSPKPNPDESKDTDRDAMDSSIEETALERDAAEVPGEYNLNEDDLQLGDDFISSALAELERVPSSALEDVRKKETGKILPPKASIDLEIVDDDDDDAAEARARGTVTDSGLDEGIEDTSKATDADPVDLLRKKVAFLEERLRVRGESHQIKLEGMQREIKKKILGLRKMKEEIDTLKAELEKAQEEARSNKENWVAAAAEYRNLQRRNRLKMNEFIEMEKNAVIKQILPVFDNLVRSLDYTEPSQALVDGVRLIAKQCQEILDTWDVRVMDAEHQQFDPYCHEAVTRIKNTDVSNNTILEVLQRGYMIGDKVLRPAKVTVSYNETISSGQSTEKPTKEASEKLPESGQQSDPEKLPEDVVEESVDNAVTETGDKAEPDAELQVNPPGAGEKSAANAIKDGNPSVNSVKSQQIAREIQADAGEDTGNEDVEEPEQP